MLIKLPISLRRQKGIRLRLQNFFIVLVIVPLLTLSLLLLAYSYRIQVDNAISLQNEISRRAAHEIREYFHLLENDIEIPAYFMSIARQPRGSQQRMLTAIRNSNKLHGDLFEELLLIEPSGKSVAIDARSVSFYNKKLPDMSRTDAFIIAKRDRTIYYESVQFSPITGEPTINMGVPLINIQTNEVEGVIVANVRLKNIWDLVSNMKVGTSGDVFITDEFGSVIASKDPSIVLSGSRFNAYQEPEIRRGLTGKLSVITSTGIVLGVKDLLVVTQMPVAEAFHYTINILIVVVILMIALIAVSITLARIVGRDLILPIEELAGTARAVSSGDLSRRAAIVQDNELGTLASSFNTMTTKLVETIKTLSDVVNERNLFNIRLEQTLADRERMNRALQDEIRERLRAEKALRTSETLLKGSQRIAHVGSWELDHTSGTLYWTEETYRIFELKPDKFCPSYQSFLERVHPEDRNIVDTAYNSSIMDKSRYDTVHRLLFEDGRIKFVREQCETSYDETGKPLYSVGSVQDITERKHAEMVIEKERDIFKTMINSMPGVFYLFNQAGTMLRWNRILELVTGFSTEEISTIKAIDFFADKDKDHVMEAIGTVFRTGYASVEANVLIRDGRSVPFLLTGAICFVDNEPCLLGVGINISDLRKMENELINAKKMESIALLAAGVAHEINNPITNASLGIQLLKQRLGVSDEPGILARLETIERNIDRAAVIAAELLMFSRQGEGEFIPLDINRILTGVLVLLDHRIETISVVKHFGNVPDISGDPIRLEQVFLNILINAIEAMPHGGEIVISTAVANNKVTVEVSDTGIGMPAEILSKVFDPFCTTKQVGSGTGLGLSICYGIIRNHSGRISIQSKEGAGTIVHVELPADSC